MDVLSKLSDVEDIMSGTDDNRDGSVRTAILIAFGVALGLGLAIMALKMD